MIEREVHGPVVVLELRHGKANALDLELASGLAEAIHAEESGDCGAVVLTGAGKIFSAGVDLNRLLDGGPEYVASLLTALDVMCRGLFEFSKPLVTALNGHAIAGGGILCCCGDYRLMARGSARVGVPELLVGVPLPPLGLEIIRFALPRATLPAAFYLGRTYPAEEALASGWVDELVAPEQLRARALEVATGLAALPVEAFRYTKEETRRPARLRAEESTARNAERLKAIWSSPETFAVVRRYVEKTLR